MIAWSISVWFSASQHDRKDERMATFLEINENKFVNLDNVFEVDLHEKKGGGVQWIFYSVTNRGSEKLFCETSMVFKNKTDAKNWLLSKIPRAV